MSPGLISRVVVADKIAAVPRGANDRPTTPIHIKKAVVTQPKG